METNIRKYRNSCKEQNWEGIHWKGYCKYALGNMSGLHTFLRGLCLFELKGLKSQKMLFRSIPDIDVNYPQLYLA